MIRALIFDCFGVFYVDPVLARMEHLLPQTARALHGLDEQAAKGNLDEGGFVAEASELLHEAAAQVEQEFFHGKARNQTLLDFAQRLRPTYKIGLLSNIGADMMDGFFTPTERMQLFDDVILSGQVRLAKPDPAIFQLACDRLGVAPVEAVMIDDVGGNCDAARSIGMQAVRFENTVQTIAYLSKMLANAEPGQAA